MHKDTNLDPVLSTTEPPRGFCAWSVDRPVGSAGRSYCDRNWTMREGAWQAHSKKLMCWSGLFREPANQHQKDRGFCLLCLNWKEGKYRIKQHGKFHELQNQSNPTSAPSLAAWLHMYLCQFFLPVLLFCFVFFSWFMVLCRRQNFKRLAWVSLLRGNMLVYLSALKCEQTNVLAVVLM